MLLIREKEISMQIEELNCGAIWEILIFIVYSNSKNRQFCFSGNSTRIWLKRKERKLFMNCCYSLCMINWNILTTDHKKALHLPAVLDFSVVRIFAAVFPTSQIKCLNISRLFRSQWFASKDEFNGLWLHSFNHWMADHLDEFSAENCLSVPW